MIAEDWSPDPRYAEYPGHDLHEVPLVILEAARAYMRTAATYNDVDPELAEPIADSVVGEVLPLIRKWMSESRQPACGADLPDHPADLDK